MCRNIVRLRRPERPPTEAELMDAARQFVRKITGYQTPSRANQEAFEEAILGIAATSRRLFEQLVVRPEVARRG